MNEVMTIPVELIDPSPFQTRERLEPLQSDDIITPLIVRPKNDGRYEIIAGHRRLETLKVRGVKEALCRVLDISDEQAALLLFQDNQERQDLTDYERGLFFEKYMQRFNLSEREAAKRLGISQTTISLCLAVVRGREMIRGLITTDLDLYKKAVTATKVMILSTLPEEIQSQALKAIVENDLSTEETHSLVRQVQATSKPVEDVATSLVNEREVKKAERYTETKKRQPCPTCAGRGYILINEDGP